MQTETIVLYAYIFMISATAIRLVMATKAIKVGLTGSLGMGKSAVSQQFQSLGFSVFDADKAVHELYSTGGEGVCAIQEIVPQAVINGTVDRKILSKQVLQNSALLKIIESKIHPLVSKKRQEFYYESCERGDFLVVYDIPLLLENRVNYDVDYILVVTASQATQRERVMARSGMTDEKFKSILNNQMPDEQKRQLADFIINTDFKEYSSAKSQLAKIIETIVERNQVLFNQWKTRNLKPKSLLSSPSSSSSSSSVTTTTVNICSTTRLSDHIDFVIFDLDDTLVPTWPPIKAANKAVVDYLSCHMPLTAQLLREGHLPNEIKRIVQENSLLSHDLTEIRRIAIRNLAASQNECNIEVIDEAIAVFLKHRSDVFQHFYDDSIPCLQWLIEQEKVKVGVLTNGNAELMTAPILKDILHISISANQVGSMKPSVVPFLALLHKTGVRCPSRILFVGDSYSNDIIGAKNCGMRTALLVRDEGRNPHALSSGSFRLTTNNNTSVEANPTNPSAVSSSSSSSVFSTIENTLISSSSSSSSSSISFASSSSAVSISISDSSGVDNASVMDLSPPSQSGGMTRQVSEMAAVLKDSSSAAPLLPIQTSCYENDKVEADMVLYGLSPDHFRTQWNQYIIKLYSC